ncbi:hypothetical protein VUR80DRAFT_10293 [Thermomyces stellatus]
MFLLTAIATAFSLLPATLTLITTFLVAILFPLIAAIILGILELTTSVVTSTESVTLLILSPPILLFPFKLVGAIGSPVLEIAGVVLAPALFPFQVLLVFAAGVLSFILEFKALYTFLATGATLGLLTGTVLHVTTSLLFPFLGLDSAPTPAAESEPRPVLHTRITRPVIRAPGKSSLAKHPPILRKHVADGPDGDVRPRRVRFKFEDSGVQNGAPASPIVH